VFAADPFLYNGAEAEEHLQDVLKQFTDVALTFFRMTSEGAHREVAKLAQYDPYIDLVHIDGDHFDAAKDCELWLPDLKPGGIAAFHDVIPDPRSNIYQVYLDVEKYTGTWPTLHWAKDENCQCIRRKL